jgi:GcrA cell cycle regulator
VDKFDWLANPTADERLKEYYDAGFSASQIATKINLEFRAGLTRNAIIGRVHRRGLQRNGKAARFYSGRKPRAPKPRAEPRIKARRAEEPPSFACEPIPDEMLPAAEGCTLLELTNETCRWPYGDPSNADFRFCGKIGADLVVARPYCAGHRRQSFARFNHQPGA